jgi:hypothetical protein
MDSHGRPSAAIPGASLQPTGPFLPPCPSPSFPRSNRPPCGTMPRRSQARSPKSQPILCADQFTNPKSEMHSGKHQVTGPHPRPGPPGRVAEIGTSVRTSSDGSPQIGTSRLPMAAGTSGFRTDERTSATTGTDSCTGLRPKSDARAKLSPTLRTNSNAGTRPRPTLRPKSGASRERCPVSLSRQPPVQNGALPFARSRTPVPDVVRPSARSRTPVHKAARPSARSLSSVENVDLRSARWIFTF